MPVNEVPTRYRSDLHTLGREASLEELRGRLDDWREAVDAALEAGAE